MLQFVQENPQQWARALDRAIDDALDVLVCAATGEAFVESASRPGTLYAVSVDGCGCAAGHHGQVCKHRAAFLAQIGELALPASPANCESCCGGGAISYRGFDERCRECNGSGVKPDRRLTGQPGVDIVAAAA